jgi:hypothetical protein
MDCGGRLLAPRRVSILRIPFWAGHRVYCEAPDSEFRTLFCRRFTVYASRTDLVPTYSTDRLEGLRDWLDAQSTLDTSEDLL